MPASAPTDPPPAPLAQSPRVVVLLCTYNEAQNLPLLLTRLEAALPQADVLVVDDNSPDGTAAIVRAHSGFQLAASEPPPAPRVPASRPPAPPAAQRSIYLMCREGKLGLGTATRSGLQWCLARGYDLIVNLDADLSHDPATAPQLVHACWGHPAPADVAVGSRYIAGGSSPGLAGHRRLISRLLNAYATRLLRLPVKDCSGSFRCYRAAALRQLDFSRLVCPGYGFLEEILVSLHRQGAQLVEVPIEFHSRRQGRSKLGLSDAWGALAVIHRLAWSRRPT